MLLSHNTRKFTVCNCRCTCTCMCMQLHVPTNKLWFSNIRPILISPYVVGTSGSKILWLCPSGILFICFFYHSFPLFLSGVGEGNYWCGTEGEEANLSLGTSEVWSWPLEAPAPHLLHSGLEEKRCHWGYSLFGIRHSTWTHTHSV